MKQKLKSCVAFLQKNCRWCWCVVLIFWSGMAFGHHPTASSVSSGMKTGSFFFDKNKPKTHVYSLYQFVHLVNSIGDIHSFVLGGEYALSSRFSLGATLSVHAIDHDFRQNNTSFGDITTRITYLLWEKAKTHSFLSSEWSLPTGDEIHGLGRNSVGQKLAYFLGYQQQEWLFFIQPAVDVTYSQDVEPILLVSLGASSPQFFGERVTARLSFSSQTFFASRDFDSGSTKIFIEPQFLVALDQKHQWILSVGSSIGVFDSLSAKNSQKFSPTDNALLNDIQWSGQVGLNFNF